MNIEKKQLTEETSDEGSIGYVLGKLISELSTIADDIEELPFTGMESLTTAELMAYQKVDFSSQKLRDFSNLLNHLTKSEKLRELSMPNGVAEELRLEYTFALLEKNAG